MSRIEYFRTPVACTRGLRLENDLPEAVIRLNADGSKEMVAMFHSRYYAEQFCDILNKEVAAMDRVSA